MIVLKSCYTKHNLDYRELTREELLSVIDVLQAEGKNAPWYRIFPERRIVRELESNNDTEFYEYTGTYHVWISPTCWMPDDALPSEEDALHRVEIGFEELDRIEKLIKDRTGIGS